MTQNQSRTWTIGDKVRPAPEGAWPASVNPAATYTITKTPRGARGVNYVANADDGGRSLRGPGWAFAPADASAALPAPTIETGPLVVPGMIAQGVVGGAQRTVVILRVDYARDKCSVAPLGGGDGTYWTRVDPRRLSVVDPARITITPAA